MSWNQKRRTAFGKSSGAFGGGAPIVIPSAFMIGESTQLFDGLEVNTFDATWGRYTAFMGLVRAPNADLITVYYRSSAHAAEDDRLVVNRSINDGRSWRYKWTEGPIVTNDNTVQEAGASLTLVGLGRIGLLYQKTDLAPGMAPNRSVIYRFSDDNGLTWSSTTSFPVLGSQFTGCAASPIVLSGGTYLTPVYYRDVGQTRYTVVMMQSVDSGTTWTQRSLIAQDVESVSARQFEEPYCRRLDDGRLMCLVRSDTNSTIYATFSADEGFSWTSLVVAFAGIGKPAWIQTANKILFAFTRNPILPSRGALWTSVNRGLTWLGPTEFQNAAHSTYEYSDPIEVSTNLVGVVHAQERLGSTTRTLLKYTEIGANTTPPIRFRNAQSIFYQSTGTNYLDYGNSNILNGSTAFTLEFWWRRDVVYEGGSQTILSREISTDRQIQILFNSTGGFLVALGTGASTNSILTIPIANYIREDQWIQTIVRYDGSQATNATKCRVWFNGIEKTADGTFTGTMPASIRTTTVARNIFVGAAEAGTNRLRSMFVTFLRLWNATAADQAFIEGTMFNGRVPQSTVTLESTLGAAKFAMRYNTDFLDEKAFLPSPITNGILILSNRWTP